MQDNLIGATLGQYRIDALLGRGGMATVYKAHQATLDRAVAIKIMSAQFAGDPAFLERFRREARAVARLDHPNILPIYDFGEQDGIPFIVMPYVTGGTLKELMGAPQSLDWSIQMCEQLARALDYAHGQDIVHRDVKPANALVGRDNSLLLADFGLAKMVDVTAGLTRTGQGIGTPEYISPEQAQGRDVDGRTDLYALASIFFEMVTGKVPYLAESPVTVILMHIQEPVPSLCSIVPSIPESVDLVVQQAMAKQPEDRFSSPGEFIDALKGAVAGDSPNPRAPAASHAVPTPRPREGARGSTQSPAAVASTSESRPKQARTLTLGLAGAAAALLLLIGGLVANRMLPGGGTAASTADSSSGLASGRPTESLGGEPPDRRARALGSGAGSRPAEQITAEAAAEAPRAPRSVLEDNFDKPAAGILAESSDRPSAYGVGYVDGEYAITLIDPAWRFLPTVLLPGAHGDVSLAIDARMLGSGGNRHFVLGCRGQPTTGASEYRFYVDPTDGTYTLERWDNDSPQSLVPWQKAPAIRLGTETNRVELSCIGSTIAGRINDAEIVSVNDATYRQGALWIGAGSFSGTFDARFDNLVATDR